MISVFGRLLLFFDKIKRKALERYYLQKLKNCGEKVYIGLGTNFNLPENISVGNSVFFGKNCQIQSVHGEIVIGNHVMFGPGVNIHGGNHVIDNLSVDDYMDQQHKEYGDDAPIIIEDDVWIGANAVILSGVHIAQGCVVGAGSIVTHDVEPYSIVAGAPAKLIRYRIMKDKKALEKDN